MSILCVVVWDPGACSVFNGDFGVESTGFVISGSKAHKAPLPSAPCSQEGGSLV